MRIGDRVLVRVGGTDAKPRMRPADVVEVYDDPDLLDLVVILNGIEDQRTLDGPAYATPEEVAYGSQCHRPAVKRGDGRGEWRKKPK